MLVVTDDAFGGHLRGSGHVESADRVVAVAAGLRFRRLLDDVLSARRAGDAELMRVHTAAYLALIETETERLCHQAGDPRFAMLSTGDVVIGSASYEVARRAAGGAILAMEQAVERAKATFALVRPPGHHAEQARGMGFCLINNALVAARAYLATYGGRVLIADFDYHHGNGIQAGVGNGVSYVSTHAWPAYPGTGSATQSALLPEGDVLVNVPLSSGGLSTEAFVAIWARLLPRVASYVRPNLILVSAGFDYVAGDPVGDLGIDVGAAGMLAAGIAEVAQRYCDGRTAYILEGGYSIPALIDSVAGVMAAIDGRMSPVSGAEWAAVPASMRRVLERLDAMLGAAGSS
ncbi:MAG: histone deacetylase family protein [Vulcanimicrobiaceae bacterium]